MSDVETQIARRQRGEISDEQLRRDLVGHEDWLFFVEEGGVERLRREGGALAYVVRQDERGEKSLHIFSGPEPVKTYIQDSGINDWRCEVMTSAGADIFATLPDSIPSVTVNPATPLAFNCGREQLDLLRRVARAAFMERDLKSLSDGSIRDHEALDRVVSDFKGYDGFHLVSFLKTDGEWTYPRYTSEDGRNWVVAFTAEDNAGLYLKECAAELPGRYRIERLAGAGLARITLALESPGVLFNWRGYVAPLMLNSQFLKLVLDAR